jgi:adhesin transport system membrane fusion protein
VTRVRKAATDAQVAYDETISKTELDRAQAYSDVLKELQTLKQTLNASQDQLTRTVLTSPMDGVVTNLAITTIGGVIRPGEEIMRIIPVDDEMFIEARVKPEDIAGVEIGQSATVKLSAYDYTIFGTLHGTVDVISADTFKDERAQDGDPHYKVTVKVAQSLLSDRQKHLEIRPGMQAQVELHTGERTVMQYLVKPLYKSTEAFGER